MFASISAISDNVSNLPSEIKINLTIYVHLYILLINNKLTIKYFQLTVQVCGPATIPRKLQQLADIFRKRKKKSLYIPDTKHTLLNIISCTPSPSKFFVTSVKSETKSNTSDKQNLQRDSPFP